MPRIAVVLAIGLLAAACSSEEIADPPTTTASVPTTSPASTTVAAAATPTSAPVPPRTLPEYQVVEKVASEDGDVLVVLLDGGPYDDIDIENLMVHIVDEYSPIGAYVVDDPEAVRLVLEEEAEGSDPVLSEHYLARLEDGNRVVYAGPLAEFGWFLVGS